MIYRVTVGHKTFSFNTSSEAYALAAYFSAAGLDPKVFEVN